MKQATRIYVVRTADRSGDFTARLVRAHTPAQAIRWCAKGVISAEVASQDDLVALASSGVRVEKAGDPDTPDMFKDAGAA